ncbi:Arm DNA-binding domain protein [compost metagenome]
MLTDTALRNLKPKSLTYKASDRDGMYVTVSHTGTVTFRYDYCRNGRRETLTIGRYGPAGISLAMSREKLIDAKKAVTQGKSPALEKQREKRRLTAAKTFGDVTGKWPPALGWPTAPRRCARASSIGTSCRPSRTGSSTNHRR